MTRDFASTAEFDAFGPWVDTVHDASEVPRLYRDFPLDFSRSTLVLKVPRNISRRDALPSMDLYDHLLIASRDRLVVLSRADAASTGAASTGAASTGAAYTESTIPYGTIAAITSRVDLLDGRLSIRTFDGGTFSVPFGGSSEAAIATLVDVMREHRQRSARAFPSAARLPVPMVEVPAVLGMDELGKQDVMFVTAFRDLSRREPGMRLLAANGRARLVPRGGGIARTLHALYPMTLHGVLLCRTELELHVFARKDWLVRGGAPVLSRAHTILSLDRIDEITVREHPRYLGVSIVVLRIDAAEIEIAVPAGSAAERALIVHPV